MWETLWGWLKGAPQPAVLALALLLGGWVWGLSTEQTIQKVRVAGLEAKMDRIEAKLDKLLEAVADLKAEQRARRPVAPAPAAPRRFPDSDVGPQPAPEPERQKP